MRMLLILGLIGLAGGAGAQTPGAVRPPGASDPAPTAAPGPAYDAGPTHPGESGRSAAEYPRASYDPRAYQRRDDRSGGAPNGAPAGPAAGYGADYPAPDAYGAAYPPPPPLAYGGGYVTPGAEALAAPAGGTRTVILGPGAPASEDRDDAIFEAEAARRAVRERAYRSRPKRR